MKLVKQADGDEWSGESENLFSISVNELYFLNQPGKKYCVVFNGYNSYTQPTDITVKRFDTREAARVFAAKIAELVNEEEAK